MASSKLIQFLLQTHAPDYLARHKQPLKVIRGIQSQIRCRTEAQGSRQYICPEDGEQKRLYHSCRHKGCSICSGKRQKQWLDTQQQRLLNCEHYHVVFTLPQDYRALWLYNRDWFIQAQFKASIETLRALLEGGRYQGQSYEGRLKATPGYIATLHTWGRSLNLHPHIHILVTAGGLNSQGQWQPNQGDYLLPVKQVKALYRGKLQAFIKAAMDSEVLRLPDHQSQEELTDIHQQCYQKEWSVRIQEKYAHGKGVLIYLSRYLGSQPVKPEQLNLINRNREVLFSYWSHRHKKQQQQRLSIDGFLKKYLLHQSRSSTHTTRYYGLYAAQSVKKRECCQAQLGEIPHASLPKSVQSLTEMGYTVLCPCCQGEMRLQFVIYASWSLKNPLYKGKTPQPPNLRQDTERIG